MRRTLRLPPCVTAGRPPRPRGRAVRPTEPGVAAWPRHPRQRGFSLLELIAVLVLIAIAVTVASISFSKSLGSAKIKAASRDLVAALRYTRGQAIVKGEQKTLDVNLEDMSYTAPGREAVKFPDKIEIKLLTAQNEVLNERTGRIRFYPDGSSTGGHISVIAGSREWRVNVGWLTGEVDLEELRER